MNVCYTAICSSYDELKDPLWIDKNNWRYICFTTQNLNSKVWEIVKIEQQQDSTRQARNIKINSTFDCDFYLWVDANIRIIGDLNSFIEPLKRFDISLMTHPHRRSIVEEMKAIIKYKKDNVKVVQSQILRYQLEGYDKKELAATGILLRKNNDIVKKHAKIWINEVLTKSCRDQLSFYYSCWKTGVVPHLFPYSKIDSDIFKYSLHLNRQKG